MGQAKRGLLAASTLEPYQQGSLDYLCSIYAATNALRLLLENLCPLSTNQVERIFRAGIRHLADENRVASALYSGVPVPVFRTLVQAMAAKASEIVQQPIHAERLKLKRHDLNRLSLGEILADGCEHGVLLILLGGVLDHFTVVRAVTDKNLLLFDSYGYHHVKLGSCSQKPGAARHHVPFGAIMVLTVDDPGID